MSIKLMSAIFETEFPDTMQDDEENKVRASTLKLVLLAIADHANDEGESAYPGLKRLERKTGLSKQGIIGAISVLKFNGILNVAEDKSRLGTNNYSINTTSFPDMLVNTVDHPHQLVNVVDQGSQPGLPGGSTQLTEVVNPVDHNHQLNTTKTSTNINGSTHSFSSFETSQLKSEYMETNTYPYRKAHTLLLNSAKIPAMPRDQESYVETVRAMVDRYGEDATKTALERACTKWISTQGKNGRNYSKTNFKWVDWAMDAMEGGGKAVDPAMKTHNELMALIRGEA
jgi:hypothetical protein